MNGWRYEWIQHLPVDVYEVLVEWIDEQAQQEKKPSA